MIVKLIIRFKEMKKKKRYTNRHLKPEKISPKLGVDLNVMTEIQTFTNVELYS